MPANNLMEPGPRISGFRALGVPELVLSGHWAQPVLVMAAVCLGLSPMVRGGAYFRASSWGAHCVPISIGLMVLGLVQACWWMGWVSHCRLWGYRGLGAGVSLLVVDAAAQAGTPEPRSEVSGFRALEIQELVSAWWCRDTRDHGFLGWLPAHWCARLVPGLVMAHWWVGLQVPRSIQEALPVPWWVALSTGPSGR